MRIIRQDVERAKPAYGDVFFGDVRVQALLSDEDAPSRRATVMTFLNCAGNVWHRHSTGLVQVERKERHWHGARPGADMTHLSDLSPGAMSVERR